MRRAGPALLTGEQVEGMLSKWSHAAPRQHGWCWERLSHEQY